PSAGVSGLRVRGALVHFRTSRFWYVLVLLTAGTDRLDANYVELASRGRSLSLTVTGGNVTTGSLETYDWVFYQSEFAEAVPCLKVLSSSRSGPFSDDELGTAESDHQGLPGSAPDDKQSNRYWLCHLRSPPDGPSVDSGRTGATGKSAPGEPPS